MMKQWDKAVLKTTFTAEVIELMAEMYLKICFNFPQIIAHIELQLCCISIRDLFCVEGNIQDF